MCAGVEIPKSETNCPDAVPFGRARFLASSLRQTGLKCMGQNPLLSYNDINPVFVYFLHPTEERRKSQLFSLSMAYPQLLLGTIIISCSAFTIKCVMSSPLGSTVFVLIV